MSLFNIKSCETLYIVYPAAITSHDFEQAETIMNRVWALCGVRPVLVCDRNKTPEEVIPEGAPAFIVGNNIMPECREVLSDITYGEGEIRVIGNRIVVAAHTDDMLIPMVSELTDSMSLKGDELVIDVPEKRNAQG